MTAETDAETDVSSDEPVVLFDGVYTPCNGLVSFLIPRDPDGRLQFAPAAVRHGTGITDPARPSDGTFWERQAVAGPRGSILARSLIKNGSSTRLTVPKEFIKAIGLHRWFERNGKADYYVRVTWLREREAFSFYFPDPETTEQPEAAIPRKLVINEFSHSDSCAHKRTIPPGALAIWGVTDDAIANGYVVFPEPEPDKRLLTVDIPHPRLSRGLRSAPRDIGAPSRRTYFTVCGRLQRLWRRGFGYFTSTTTGTCPN